MALPPIPILPVAIGAAVITAAVVIARGRAKTAPASSAHGEGGGLTPAKQALYERALASDDPSQQLQVAVLFDQAGLTDQARMLRKRAALQNLSPAEQAERQDIYRKAMATTDKKAAVGVAQLFAADGCMKAAQDILKYAESLP